MIHTRRVLFGCLMVAVTAALGYAFAGVPNVELMTFTVFVTGFLLGSHLGTIIGAVAVAVHSVFNPLGAAMPPLLIGQILGFALIGWVGGWSGPKIVRVKQKALGIVLAGGVGFLLTLFYGVLTNVGAFYSISGDDIDGNLVKFIIGGLTFTLMHLVWNTVLFSIVLVPALAVLGRYRSELHENSL